MAANQDSSFSKTATATIIKLPEFPDKVGFVEINLNEISNCPNRQIQSVKVVQE